MVNLKKVSRLLNSYLNYIKRNPRPNYWPCRVWIEVTSNCNLECPLCPNRDMEPEQKGFMDYGLFTDIIDQLGSRVNDIYLFHRGEPFLHPQLMDMIGYAKKTPATVRIHTNATLLDKEKSHQVISSGLDFISFSFDGYQKETYEQHRVNSNFEQTVKNILYFLNLKRQLGSKTPYTVLQIMEYGPQPQPEVKQEFFNRFKGLPLNRVITRKPHNWAGLVPGALPAKKSYVPCTFLWYALVILFNGDILPCPQDFEARLNLGNINSDSAEAVFKGQKMQRLRKKIAAKDIGTLVPCKDCDRLWRNTFMGLPQDYLKTFIKDNWGAN